MMPLLLTLHLSVPQLQPAQAPRLQLAHFAAPSLVQVLDLQLPPPATPAVDPYKGSLRAGEVGVGIGTAVLGSVASVLLGATVAVLGSAGSSQEVPAGLVAGILVDLGLQLVAVPAAVALVEYGYADLPLAGSLWRAVGYVAVAQVGAVVGSIVLGVVVDLLVHTNGAVGSLVFLALELVGLPIAASLGLHGGDEARGPGEVVAPVPALTPDAPPPQLAPPPMVPGAVPTMPPTALNFSFRF